MRSVIQRVNEACCKVDGKITGQIKKGLVIFVAFTNNDDQIKLEKFVQKMLKLRIFEDSESKMNLNISAINGQILLISQFTLYGDIKDNHRPSFIEALKFDAAKILYEDLIKEFNKYLPVQIGQFGGDMQITQVNDGPVSIIYEL